MSKFKKTITMRRLDDKETKGCFRYGKIAGDAGVTSLYLRKESIEGHAPRLIELTIKAVD